MAIILYVVFFISGASALIFESLLFRQAGLTFGNSVWASTVVLASFMCGLAIGNFAVRRADRLRSPLRLYAVLEAAIGATGFSLVVALPKLTSVVASLLGAFADRPGAMNALRFALAFPLMVLPAAAMGGTLPLLATAMSRSDANLGRVLGRLYGINTIGAVAGALAAELLFVPQFGVRGTAAVAALFNLLAAAGATFLSTADDAPHVTSASRWRADRSGRLLLAAAAVSGAILLALEVVWFRFSLLWNSGTSLAFAIMLAVVLAAIGLGGVLASAIFTRLPSSESVWLTIVPLVSGAALVLCYLGFDATGSDGRFAMAVDPGPMLLLAARLMFPVSFLSGLLFTAIGRAVASQAGEEAGAAVAALSLSNTLGAMAGAFIGGFVLIPVFGMERSFFILAICYGIVALLCAGAIGFGQRIATPAAATAFILMLVFFPFGLMRETFLPTLVGNYAQELGERIVAAREGRTETAVYLQRDLWGEAEYFRLFTNSHSMSSTTFQSRRYMNLFADFAFFVHPKPRKALLISYGVGVTAKALTSNPHLTTIDVVDISRDILELNKAVPVHPVAHPLDDKRVRVHVEDGRTFLAMTPEHFDIITAEPPPPKSAGIVNLYSQEYFELAKSRLARGGVITYWLPVYQLERREAKAIIRAFCNAFDDCTLWSGVGLEWMLVGTNGLQRGGPFGTLWQHADYGAHMRELVFPKPELIGTAFIADAKTLREMVRDTPPLTDDFPARVSWRHPRGTDPFYDEFSTPAANATRFARSEWVAGTWPAALRRSTIAAAPLQRAIDLSQLKIYGGASPSMWPAVEWLLDHEADPTIPLLLLGVDEHDVQLATRAIARGVTDPLARYVVAADAVSRRDYARAETMLQASPAGEMHNARLRAFARAMSGDAAGAAAIAATLRGEDDTGFATWYAQRVARARER